MPDGSAKLGLRPEWFGRDLADTARFYAEAQVEAGNRWHEARRKLAEHDLFYLLASVCGRLDMMHPWIFARCREVQLAHDGYLDLWGRDHYKSTIVTFGLCLQKIIRDPEITIGILSHTRPIAKGFLKQIKRELEGNRTIHELFPDVFFDDPVRQAPMWSEDGGMIVRRKSNPKEATLEAWGLVDGQPTSKHWRDRVYDDIVTRESVTTSDMIRKTTEAFELSSNLGSDGGTFRAVGTRYALHDTYSEIMKRGVLIPRIYPATDDGSLTGKPVLFTAKRWAEAKKLQTSTIAAQLLMDPLAAGMATFQLEWLKHYDVRPRTLNVYIMGDPSRGPGNTHRDTDSTAIVAVGISSSGARYLLDGWCHRMPLTDRWQNLKTLYTKWYNAPGVMYVAVGWERYGLQADDQYFQEQMRRENVAFSITELSWTREGNQSKDSRIERLEPWFRTARFFVPGLVDPALAPRNEDGNRFPFATWHVERNQLSYVGMLGEPGAIAKAQLEGDEALVARPIRRLDEEKRPYDLTAKFFEQYLAHPVGAHDDLIDAMSRLEDMDPAAPQIISDEERLGPEYPDA